MPDFYKIDDQTGLFFTGRLNNHSILKELSVLSNLYIK
jgi:hypothetical protein